MKTATDNKAQDRFNAAASEHQETLKTFLRKRDEEGYESSEEEEDMDDEKIIKRLLSKSAAQGVLQGSFPVPALFYL